MTVKVQRVIDLLLEGVCIDDMRVGTSCVGPRSFLLYKYLCAASGPARLLGHSSYS